MKFEVELDTSIEPINKEPTMNQDTIKTKEMIKVMKAFNKGKQIEWRYLWYDTWTIANTPKWDWIRCEYRVAKNKDYGWRLPTIVELQSIANYEKFEPACDMTDTISYGYYWSSTPLASGSSFAWYVDFKYGNSFHYYKTYKNYVRCVRDTPGGLEWSKSSTKTMDLDEAKQYAKTLTDEDVYRD